MRRPAVIAFRVLALLLVLAGTAWAGNGIWTGNGPTGAATRAVLVDPAAPSTTYVGTVGSGVFKSIDTGATWVQTDPTGPIATRTVRSLVFGPPGTIYAGSDNAVDSQNGVFQSVNGGATWTPL